MRYYSALGKAFAVGLTLALLAAVGVTNIRIPGVTLATRNFGASPTGTNRDAGRLQTARPPAESHAINNTRHFTNDPTTEPSPTPFPMGVAESGPVKAVSSELSQDIVRYCSGSDASGADAKRLYYNALTVIVGRLNAAGLSTYMVGDSWVSTVDDCYSMEQVAWAINVLVQRLK